MQRKSSNAAVPADAAETVTARVTEDVTARVKETAILAAWGLAEGPALQAVQVAEG